MKMTMTNPQRATTLLVLVAALVGGSGCLTMAAIDKANSSIDQARHQRQLQEKEQAHRTALANGDVQAQFVAAISAPKGSSTQYEWLKKASAQGHLAAQAMLAQGDMRGWGVASNPAAQSAQREQGAQVLRLLAMQYCDIPQFGSPALALATQYLTSEPRDVVEAANWAAVAGQQCKLPMRSIFSQFRRKDASDAEQLLALSYLLGYQEWIVQLEKESPQVIPLARTRLEKLRSTLASQPLPKAVR